jgi:hypothetical protein
MAALAGHAWAGAAGEQTGVPQPITVAVCLAGGGTVKTIGRASICDAPGNPEVNGLLISDPLSSGGDPAR